MKYLTISFFLSFLLSNILNGLYYTITADFHTFAMTKSQPRMDFLMLNHAVFAGMMSYLYPRFLMDKNEKYLKNGMWFGVCMGIVMFVPSALVVRGAWEVPITYFFPIDIIFHLLVSGLMGMVISLAHRKFYSH